MSLKTDFIAKEERIILANTCVEKILAGEPLMMNKGYWRYKYYNTTSSSSPTISTIAGMTPTKTMLRADASSYTNLAWGDNYVGYAQCWVKCNQAYTLSTQFYTDDYGRVYLNGVSKATSGSCTNTSVSLNFVKGWNKVIIMWQEGGGGDGGNLLTKLSTQSFVDELWAEKLDEPND